MDNKNLEIAYKRDAENAFEVKQVLESRGFTIINKQLQERLEQLDSIIYNSINPNEVFACIKEKKGILFFLDVANELVRAGKTATERLAIS